MGIYLHIVRKMYVCKDAVNDRINGQRHVALNFGRCRSMESGIYIQKGISNDSKGTEKKKIDCKTVLAEIQEVFHDDKGWDNEESMIADMAAFRKERIEL